jgi:hypothetical protein
LERGWLESICRKELFTFVQADLSSMQRAVEVIQQLSSHSINTVVFTIGIVNGSIRKETKEGIEMETAVSFLSRFAMTKELLEQRDRVFLPSAVTLDSTGETVMTGSRKPRIFVMGFPGGTDTPNIDDFTWEEFYLGGIVGGMGVP